ncbi:Yip1 family protein [Tunturibacter empetritectus]|uniref:Yip1 family protein n=1 Tax=Tunturiibacter empetritectus TaxID=3069691 RepID=A0AAU7ZIA4_9BACT
MNDVVAVDTQSGQPGLSQVERLVDTFIAPSKTFTDILRSTSWWLPFLLAVIVSIGVTFTIDRQVGFSRVAENMILDSPKQEEQIQSLPEDQRAARMHGIASFTKNISYGTPVIILLISAVGALVNWASFNFGLGARTTFGQMFCVWMYASLPRLLSGLLTLVTVMFGGNAESFNLKNPVGTNPAYFMPDAAPWLKAALGFLDVIGIWNVILLVIGTSIVAKVSRGKAAAVVVGWWALVLILSVASAAMSS